jgi:acyl-CoA synthetase (AMP-forming)/AMP-acid ligase II
MDDATYARLLAKAQLTKDLFTFDDFLRYWAQDRPDRLALEGDDLRFTFAGLEDATARVASGLLAMGVAKGERIAWYGKNSATYFTLFFGAARAGIVMVPIGWRLAEPEAAFIIDNAEARLLFLGEGFEGCAATLGQRPGLQRCFTVGEAQRELIGAARGAFEASGADDAVLQLYTSGTTGKPKGAVLSNRNLFGLRKAGLENPPPHSLWDEDEAVLVAMPCAHIGGTGLGIVALASGLPGIVLTEFDPVRVFDAVQNRGVTRFFIVPAALQLLLGHPDCAGTDFSRIKYISYGASPIPLELLRQCIEVFGAEFIQNYGMTETTGTVCALPPEDHSVEGNPRMRSAGKPLPGVEMIIRGSGGEALPVGEIGEIVTRSSANMLGYWKLPEATASTMDAGGWIATGDVGYMDEDGYVYIYDRAKDMIISGGENVYPAEVESAIYGHPDVLEVAVIGVPDEKWGEAVKAVCVVKPGHTIDADSVIAWARERVAGFKVPKSVDTIPALPRNPSGKILRRELREPYWAGRERQVN